MTVDPLQCRDGERRIFTDQTDIARTKRKAPWGVGRNASRVNCILLGTAFEWIILHMDGSLNELMGGGG